MVRISIPRLLAAAAVWIRLQGLRSPLSLRRTSPLEVAPHQQVPGQKALPTSSMESLHAFKRATLFIHPPVCPKARIGDHNALSLRNQSLALLALPRRCTLWTGGNPPWSLSELGSVPHLARSGRIGSLPGSRRRAPPTPSSTTARKSRPTPTTQAGASPLASCPMPRWRSGACGVPCRPSPAAVSNSN